MTVNETQTLNFTWAELANESLNDRMVRKNSNKAQNTQPAISEHQDGKKDGKRDGNPPSEMNVIDRARGAW